MKIQIFILSLVITMVAFTAASQTSNSAAGNLPPGLQNRNPLPPGLEKRDQLPPGLAKRGTNDLSQNTNSFSSSNQFGMTTNRFSGASTNQFSSTTNQPSGTLTPTSDRHITNRSSGSGQTNASTSSMIMEDTAVTSADRVVLTQIQQTVRSQFSSLTSAGGTFPVHFIVRDRVVEIVGSVPTVEEKQRIETAVQRIPTVARVESRLVVKADSTTTTINTSSGASVQGGTQTGVTTTDTRIGTSTNQLSATSTRSNIQSGSLSATNQMGGSTNLSPTSTTRSNIQSQSYSTTNQSGGGTNLSPTSRTNDLRNLPPGLQKRDELPPGLQREQLPPGLERRTNTSQLNL
jgi:hypothetical protein